MRNCTYVCTLHHADIPPRDNDSCPTIVLGTTYVCMQLVVVESHTAAEGSCEGPRQLATPSTLSHMWAYPLHCTPAAVLAEASERQLVSMVSITTDTPHQA